MEAETFSELWWHVIPTDADDDDDDDDTSVPLSGINVMG
jgi:hypothetical protein